MVIVLGRNEGCCADQAPALDYRSIPEPIPTASWETIWMIWSLFRFLTTQQVDVLFCPGNTYTIVCVAMRFLLGDRFPPVVVKISNDLERQDMATPFRFFYRAWLRIQGKQLDHFVALAEPMRSELICGLGIAADKVSVIVDPALSANDILGPIRDPAESFSSPNCKFLSVGRLVPQKNYALLIDAFALHSWPGDTLVIAGEGPDRKSLEKRIARHGLCDRITLPGHVADIPQMLAQADVFVLSSDYEGVPAVIVEALAAGLPIAATRCCTSMEWLLGHGQFGVLASLRNPQSLGAAINVARHLNPSHIQMRRFAAQFTVEEAGDRYLDILSRLIDARRGQRKNHSEKTASASGDSARTRRLTDIRNTQSLGKPDQALDLKAIDTFTVEPHEGNPKLRWARVLGAILSLFVIVAALNQARSIDVATMAGLVPRSPVFWALFCIGYLAGPLSEWLIYRRLWHVGPGALGALVRKLICNELLVGYLGEVYFYGWVRKHLSLVKAPFGAVKDVAIMSALAGNVMTLLFLAMSVPFVALLPAHNHAVAFGWSFAVVIGTSFAAMLWRRSIFSLEGADLKFIFGIHIGRILASTSLAALLWHMVLPETPIGWWLVLATLRLLISRLPFVTNKDVIFAGVAVLALGDEGRLAALIAMMAALTLVTHLVVALTLAIGDLAQGNVNAICNH